MITNKDRKVPGDFQEIRLFGNDELCQGGSSEPGAIFNKQQRIKFGAVSRLLSLTIYII